MLSMQESEGLAKLTEYLNQTRKQAAMSIDVLNNQIAELRAESDYNRQLVDELRADRDHYKQLGEQLRYETTTKHKLQERDDWKTLIDNMQKDRTRLSEECIQLRSQLQSATYEISLLHDEINEQKERESSIDKESTSSSPSTTSRAHRSPSTSTNGADLRSIIQSHSHDSSAADFDLSPFLDNRSPSSSSSRHLKVELMKVQLELEAERCKIEAERMHHKEEIRRLRHEIEALSGAPQSFPATDGSAYRECVGAPDHDYHMPSSTRTGEKKRSSRHRTSTDRHWFIDFIFPMGTTAAAVSSYQKDRGAQIIHV